MHACDTRAHAFDRGYRSCVVRGCQDVLSESRSGHRVAEALIGAPESPAALIGPGMSDFMVYTCQCDDNVERLCGSEKAVCVFYQPVAVPTILFLLGESMAFSFFGERETNDLTAADARFIAAFIFFLGAMRGEVCP